MTAAAAITERAAVVALLRARRKPAHVCSELIEQSGSALVVLQRELAAQAEDPRRGQMALPQAAQDVSAQNLLAQAQSDLRRWDAAGLHVLTVLDPGYPDNLRAVHDRPPLLFHLGSILAADQRAIAIIGARRPSAPALQASREIATHLAHEGLTIVSGLAAGIDTAAHIAALAIGARTIAVIGTGLDHAYPPRNRELQRRIGREGAVVSQFWPDTPPSRTTFPLRNATMSGLALATVIVEASQTSGARIQARRALAHGRPVFLARRVLDQPWAREFATRPGVTVADDPEQIATLVDRAAARDVLTRG